MLLHLNLQHCWCVIDLLIHSVKEKRKEKKKLDYTGFFDSLQEADLFILIIEIHFFLKTTLSNRAYNGKNGQKLNEKISRICLFINQKGKDQKKFQHEKQWSCETYNFRIFTQLSENKFQIGGLCVFNYLLRHSVFL